MSPSGGVPVISAAGATNPRTRRVASCCPGAGMAHVSRALMNHAESMRTRDPPEKPSLVDLQLAAEIRLLGDVIAAAGPHVGPLTQAELDAALGLGHTPERALGDQGPPGKT